MKILIINYRFFVSGGPEKYMFNLMDRLKEDGHEVVNFSVLSDRNQPSPYEKYFVPPIGGMDQVYYEDYRKNPRTVLQLISRGVYSLSVKKAVKRIIADTDPDVVYILHFINKLSPSVIVGAKEMGKRVVVRLSDYFLLCPRFDFLYGERVCEDCVRYGLRSCVKKKCVKNSTMASLIRVLGMKVQKWLRVFEKADVFVCPSLFLRGKLIENGYPEEKILHLPTFTPDVPHDLDTSGTYGIYYGRLSKEKGLMSLLQAYEMLGNKRELHIVGLTKNAEAARLIDYAKKHGLTNVKFPGFMSGEDLAAEIRGARFVCLPALWYENVPNTILEAFAAGKPVIASRIGSLCELVDDGENGLLHEPNKPEEIAHCIMKMDSDAEALRMGRAARGSFERKYTAGEHYRRLMQILQG